MKLLITGSSGFIGTKLLNLLYQEKIADLLLIQHTSKPVIAGKKKPAVIVVNNENIEAHKKAINTFAPDVVIHLAGMSYIPDTETHQDQTLISNLIFTHKLLNILEEANPKYFIFSSTAGLYRSSRIPQTEISDIDPSNTYLHSKLLCELRIQHSLPRTKKVIMRITNVYGDGCQKPFIITKIVEKIKNNSSIISLGNVSVVRDFLHVNDVASSLMSIIKQLDKVSDNFNIYNVSAQKSISINEIVYMFQTYVPQLSYVIDKTLFRPKEKQFLYVSSERFRKTFLWYPTESVEKYISDICKMWSNNGTNQ